MKADFYFCGQCMGQREVDDNSIVGLLIRGEFEAAIIQVGEMMTELNNIPGVESTIDVKVGDADTE